MGSERRERIFSRNIKTMQSYLLRVYLYYIYIIISIFYITININITKQKHVSTHLSFTKEIKINKNNSLILTYIYHIYIKLCSSFHSNEYTNKCKNKWLTICQTYACFKIFCKWNTWHLTLLYANRCILVLFISNIQVLYN